MNGLLQEGGALVTSTMEESYEPQSKRQKMGSDGDKHLNSQSQISSGNTELGKLKRYIQLTLEVVNLKKGQCLYSQLNPLIG